MYGGIRYAAHLASMQSASRFLIRSGLDRVAKCREMDRFPFRASLLATESGHVQHNDHRYDR